MKSINKTKSHWAWNVWPQPLPVQVPTIFSLNLYEEKCFCLHTRQAGLKGSLGWFGLESLNWTEYTRKRSFLKWFIWLNYVCLKSGKGQREHVGFCQCYQNPKHTSFTSRYHWAALDSGFKETLLEGAWENVANPASVFLGCPGQQLARVRAAVSGRMPFMRGQRWWVARLWLWLQGGCSNAAQSRVAIDVALGTTSEQTAARQLFHLRHFAL